MKKDSLIYIPGHNGLVGSALLRKLKKAGYQNLIYRTHRELNLTNQKAVQNFFHKHKPDYVFMCAGKVGGIEANRSQPALFIYENLMMAANIIHNSYLYKVKKLLYLGSSCMYPANCPQPIKEEYLLTNTLEETNYAYAIAKITGLKMCQAYREQYGCDFISAIPNNVYGPDDKHDLQSNHVIPALIKKILYVKQQNNQKIILFGSGNPRREFLFNEDLAEALIFLMRKYSQKDPINVSPKIDYSIKDVANLIKDIIGFKGKIKWDKTKPDGMPRKILDVTKINALGWEAKTSLAEGLKKTLNANYYRNPGK